MRLALIATICTVATVGCASTPPAPLSAFQCQAPQIAIEDLPAPSLSERQLKRLREGDATATFILVQAIGVTEGAAELMVEPNSGILTLSAADLAGGGQFINDEGGVLDTIRLSPIGESLAAGWAHPLTHPGTMYLRFGEALASANVANNLLLSPIYKSEPTGSAPAVYAGVVTLCVDIQNILFGGWSVRRLRVESVDAQPEAHIPLVADALWDGAQITVGPIKLHSGDLVFKTFED